MAPTISDGALRHFWAAEYVFGGAVVGMAIGVIVSLVVSRFRSVILRLIELVMACVLLIGFLEDYWKADARLQWMDFPIAAAAVAVVVPLTLVCLLLSFFSRWRLQVEGLVTAGCVDPLGGQFIRRVYGIRRV